MVDFDNITVTGKVGIGIENPTEKLEVDGKVKATAFIGDGSEIIALNGETIATLAKGWQEHTKITSGNPHGTTAEQLLNVKIVQFNFTHNSPAEPQPSQILEFVPKLILISGGYNVLLTDGPSYGSVVSGFWTKAQGNICSTFEVKVSTVNVDTIVGVAPLLFSIQSNVISEWSSSRTLKGTIDFQESTRSLKVKLTKSEHGPTIALKSITIEVSLMMLCIG